MPIRQIAFMKWLHLIVGCAYIVVFLATGHYMRVYFETNFDGDIGTRMMYRSAHVYILSAALINLVLGAYWVSRPGWLRWVQWVGSLAILAAPTVFLAAFFLEPAPDQLVRPYALSGLILAFGGSILHALTSIKPGGNTEKMSKGQ